MFGLFKKNHDAGDLLKEATSAKKAGNIDKAITILKKAYKAISKDVIIYSPQTFLRLPLYLQEAGKPEEAWKEFQLLLNKGYPNQNNDTQLMPMDHSIIYDKMRLFLQREGKNIEAIKYGIFSNFSWASGLYVQRRMDEFRDYTADDAIDAMVLKLLKKAKKQKLKDTISKIVKNEIKKIPNIDFRKLELEIDNILSQE